MVRPSYQDGIGSASADASANLYSLIETAKANNVEPYAYLRTAANQYKKSVPLRGATGSCCRDPAG